MAKKQKEKVAKKTTDNTTKVDINVKKEDDNIIKVDLDNPKKQEDAVSEQKKLHQFF